MTSFERFDAETSADDILNLLLKNGWRLHSENKNEFKVTRPQKSGGVSGIVNRLEKKFTNFSSNTDLPIKSNTRGYNFYELWRHYEFGGDTQKINDYIYKNYNTDGLPQRRYHVLKQVQRKEPPRPIQFYTNEFYHKFAEYEDEERCAIYQYDAHKTRHEAEQLVIKENPNAKRERVYRIAINKFIINKNCNEQGEPLPNFYDLTNRFQNNYLTIDELGQAVCKGFSQVYCNMIENEKGEIHKCSESFINCDLFALDFDEGSIEEFLSKPRPGAVALYTSYNHTEKINKFRILFELPIVIEKQTDFKQIITKFINEYKSDPACKDPARAFYGATNTMFFNLKTGNIQYGKDFKEWT